MLNVLGGVDEFERAAEAGLGDAKRTVKAQVVKTGKSTGEQVKVSNREFTAALYGIVSGPEAGQDDPQKQQDAKQSEAEEQKGPKSNAEKFEPTLAGQFSALIPGQRKTEYEPSSGSLENQFAVLPGVIDRGNTVSIGEQVTGQSESKDIRKLAGIDPTKQMSAEDSAKLDETQKAEREHMRRHDQVVIKGALDISPTLQQKIGEAAQERKKRDEDAKREDEKKAQEKREQKAKEKNNRPLQAGGKGARAGNKKTPMAVGNERTKTETRSRGGGG